jgi:hypothetical protein
MRKSEFLKLEEGKVPPHTRPNDGHLHFRSRHGRSTTSQGSSAAFLAGKKTSTFFFGRNIARVKIVP